MAEPLAVSRLDASRACDDGSAERDGLDRIGTALADPIRREVLLHLLDGSHCPSDLAEAIGTSRSNLSNHLACLRGCGLITAHRAGRHLHYELTSPELGEAIAALATAAANLPAAPTTHLTERVTA